MKDYEFLPDDGAMPIVLNSLGSAKTTSSMLRLALSLGAVIAGGAAISLFESRNQKEPTDRNQTLAAPRARKKITSRFLWRDVDFWFPNEESLRAYLATIATDPNIKHKASFGGHAIDMLIPDGGPQLQVITFRTGSPVEIISQFDFTNCAVAFDGKGFWFHRDVPFLAKQKKLTMLNDNSAWFMSRVYKYLKKGYYTVDDRIQVRLFTELNSLVDRGLELAKSFSPLPTKTLSEFDSGYKPVFKAICKAEGLMNRFMNLPSRGEESSLLFTKEQFSTLQSKSAALSEMRVSLGESRTKTFNLPAGYNSVSSDTSEPDVDSLLGLV